MHQQPNQLNQFAQLDLIRQQDQQSVLKAGVFCQHGAQRQQLENFIRSVFARYYQASIEHFYPVLLGAFDSGHQPFAAIGYRQANEQQLFLEQYLDVAIEHVLGSLQDTLINRYQIVEIGNLAASKPGACLRIFQLLSLYFHHSDIQWVVFTSTRTVRLVLKRLHLNAYPLSSASSDQLSVSQNWGSYYDNKPIVMAAPVAQTIAPIKHRYQLTVS